MSLCKIIAAPSCDLEQLGHKNLILACAKCIFIDFFLLKYALTQEWVINIFHCYKVKTMNLLESFLMGDNTISTREINTP